MKKLFLPVLTAVLLIAAPLSAEAKDITADSEITAVTVYSNRATVTRTATVDVPAGAHTVLFEGLPQNISGDSLRVEGSATADVTFGALSHQQVVTQELTSEKERELSDALQKLRDLIETENAEIQALDARLALLRSIGQTAVKRSNEEFENLQFQPDQWAAAAEAMQSGTAEVLKARQQHQINIRTLNEAVRKVETELRQMRTGQRRTHTVSVPLESAAATKLTVKLSYQVANASWKPVYDARLDTENGDLQIVQYGAVRQLTGEDWRGVALTLSTAQPHRGASPPPLNTVWVRKQPEQRAGRASVQEAANVDALQEWRRSAEVRRFEADFADGVAASPPQARQARFAGAEIDTGGFVTEYRVAGPATIASDNNETKLMVGAFDVDTALEVHIQPQHTTEAFLVARGTLKGDAPLLPGEVSLFRDGAYVGKSGFPLLRPGEAHDLFFGVDDRIAVKRNTLKDERRQGGMIVRDSILERHYVTEIQNLRRNPVELRVREAMPVSQDGDIKIDIQRNATTAGYAEDVENTKGLLQWNVTLPPQQKTEVKLGWRVTWPASDNVIGLP
ncbi:MAG: mucoidy inhibitor MuiA family protein [Micavibrio sp.]|nr:MAG: mucoidy inhibitor MuiA family protein [Micavibrio sp.]